MVCMCGRCCSRLCLRGCSGTSSAEVRPLLRDLLCSFCGWGPHLDDPILQEAGVVDAGHVVHVHQRSQPCGVDQWRRIPACQLRGAGSQKLHMLSNPGTLLHQTWFLCACHKSGMYQGICHACRPAMQELVNRLLPCIAVSQAGVRRRRPAL